MAGDTLIQLAITVVGVFIVVPLIIRGVNRLDEWLTRGFEWLFEIFKGRRR